MEPQAHQFVDHFPYLENHIGCHGVLSKPSLKSSPFASWSPGLAGYATPGRTAWRRPHITNKRLASTSTWQNGIGKQTLEEKSSPGCYQAKSGCGKSWKSIFFKIKTQWNLLFNPGLNIDTVTAQGFLTWYCVHIQYIQCSTKSFETPLTGVNIHWNRCCPFVQCTFCKD